MPYIPSKNEDFDRKFSYTDIENHPELIDAAEDWLRTWEGDYPFLVQAKGCLHRRGYLETAMAKGVLNCMRHDCEIEPLLKRMYMLRGRRPEPVVPVREQRPPYININNFKINKGFGYSTFKRAQYVHIVCKDRCEVTYYNHVDKWRVRIKVFCSSDVGGSKHLKLTNEPPLEMLICRTCRTMAQDDPAARQLLEEVDGIRARFAGTMVEGFSELLRPSGRRRPTAGEDEELPSS